MTLVKSRNPIVKIIVSKDIRKTPKSDGNVHYEDVSVENAAQEFGIGPKTSAAMKANAKKIADSIFAV